MGILLGVNLEQLDVILRGVQRIKRCVIYPTL
jgi:hypothetical protein